MTLMTQTFGSNLASFQGLPPPFLFYSNLNRHYFRMFVNTNQRITMCQNKTGKASEQKYSNYIKDICLLL